MAKVQNTFLKSKMNKDLDARLLPDGEYRDARNAQISKSEGSKVGNLENTLGNFSIADYSVLTGDTDIVCIGSFADELNNTVYLFFTDYKDQNPNLHVYSPTAKNYIISTNILSNISTVLVKGAFLNFSQTNLITGINILEDLLFFTDNRNQPRVINTTLANSNPSDNNPTYYTTEDQISVAKYNPYEAMELWQQSVLSTSNVQDYESTMKDVSTLFLPNGGTALSTSAVTSATIPIDNVVGEINEDGSPYGSPGAPVSLQTNLAGGDFTLTSTGQTVDSCVPGGTPGAFTLTMSNPITVLDNQKLVFNPNPYFDARFSGDPDFLESKFPRFSYRFKFTDNEYSIFAPFTQIAFIPKQDGYFMFVDPTVGTSTGSQAKNDQDEAYRSTIVYFVENKVNKIDLKIPLPFNNYDMEEALKIKEIDILYKESDGMAVRVVETIPIDKVTNQSGVCLVDGNQGPIAIGNNLAIKNIQGGITVGSVVFGPGIDTNTRVTEFLPTDPSNPVAGNIKVDKIVTLVDDNAPLIIGDIQRFNYSYESTKPTKTLPESNLIRVYDKTPVRAQAQEVAGNRVIYGNFQNKINPPSFLDYNVASTPKSDFELYESVITYTAGAATYAAGDPITVAIAKFTPPAVDGGGLFVGYIVTCNAYGSVIPSNTQVTSTTNNTSTGAATITLSNTVTFPAGTFNIIAAPGGTTEESVTKIEYPNSSVKTNRNYQVGFVLSDRYGRQSSVILSNSTTSIIATNGQEFGGSTLYSPYIDESVDPIQWPGNSLKILMNAPVPNNNLYNGDITSVDYNPLGWYSYKIVVKQQEQEYYNVYLPGIMASYPNDTTLEVGQTSHTVLINDNINKVPRDLTEVGPDQKQFRSSVQLIGRVQNTTTAITTNVGASNTQYYPQRTTDTVSVISTVNDLFDFNPVEPPLLNLFPQFYSLESNPLIARLSTELQIGQLANSNYLPAGGESLNMGSASSTIPVTSVSGDTTLFAAPNLLANYLVSGIGIPSETYVNTNTTIGGGGADAGTIDVTLKDAAGTAVTVNLPANIKIAFTPTTGSGGSPAFSLTRPGLQYLSVAETEPVESALDIFWETSTSGLISELNQAVLNNQAQPAGSNITWNPDFNEGLAQNGNILAAAFSVVDNFGQIVPVTATDIVEVLTITNGNGDSVNGQVRDYFRLEDLGTSGTGYGPWQIKTTSQTTVAGLGGPVDASVNYFDNVYYFYNNDEALRQFTFTFRVVIDGQESFITKQANLDNVAPEFFKVTAQNVNTPDVAYGPGGTTPLITQVPVQSNKSALNIALIKIKNGAANNTDPNPNGGRALSARDLDIVDQNFVDPFIWSQNIGSPDGPVAEVNAFGSPQPIFSLAPTIGLTGDGTLEWQLKNDFFQDPTLISAGIYYITLALQDAGGTLIFQQIEVNMTLQLNGNNFYNKLQQVGAFGLFSNYSNQQDQYLLSDNGVEDFCGPASFCQPPGTSTRWWNYPATVFEVTNSNPGASADTYGWYLYALGYFANTSTDASLCCDISKSNGTAPSLSLVDYSQLVTPGNTITIPMNTPITEGNHLVQKQPTSAEMLITGVQIPVWGLPPLIHGRIAVTAYSGAPNHLWTYTILEGDSTTAVENGAPGTALTGCMKLFKDVGGDASNPGAGWNYINAPVNKAQMESHVLNGYPARRTPRIKYTTRSINGDLKFQWVPGVSAFSTSTGYESGGVAMLNPNHDYATGPQIIYTYGGPQNFKTSPWFFSPTTGTTSADAEELQRLWAMYTYSGWVGAQWTGLSSQSGRKNWGTQWCQTWERNTYPLVIDPVNDGLVNGLQAKMLGDEPSCPSWAGHSVQLNRPQENEDVSSRPSSYQYSVI